MFQALLNTQTTCTVGTSNEGTPNKFSLFGIKSRKWQFLRLLIWREILRKSSPFFDRKQVEIQQKRSHIEYFSELFL